MATILYERRLGCLENSVPQATMDYIEALGLMFCTFKTSMYAGAIPRWLRPLIPKPWREFCRSWDGLFKFSKRRGRAPFVESDGPDFPPSCVSNTHADSGYYCRGYPDGVTCYWDSRTFRLVSRMSKKHVGCEHK